MILPAIKSFKDLEKFIESDYKRCVMLDTHIGHLTQIISLLNKHDKEVLIHIDLIKGLSSDEAAVEYIIQQYRPAGIVTTKPKLIKKAKQLKVLTILRVFILDKTALERSIKLIQLAEPDYVEVLPGIASKVINNVKQATQRKIIAGGLIETEDEVKTALAHGAELITTSNIALWKNYRSK